LSSYPNKIKNIFFEFFGARKPWHFKNMKHHHEHIVGAATPFFEWRVQSALHAERELGGAHNKQKLFL